VFNYICSLSWLLVIFKLGEAVFRSKKTGLVCLAIAVFNPYTIRIAGKVLREPLHILLVSCGMLFCIKIICGEKILLYSALLGIFTILAAWSRLEGIEMLLWMPLAAILYYFRNTQVHPEIRLKQILGGIIGYLCCLCFMMIILFSSSPGYIDGLQLKAGVFIKRLTHA
ncbi:MAG: hypothetical protein IJU23_09920, partial [Proteobacteria bacterium]|nr:hypothetical protein [Pseudomonadota bacterium]